MFEIKILSFEFINYFATEIRPCIDSIGKIYLRKDNGK
jgi:hypothetical protein